MLLRSSVVIIGDTTETLGKGRIQKERERGKKKEKYRLLNFEYKARVEKKKKKSTLAYIFDALFAWLCEG